MVTQLIPMRGHVVTDGGDGGWKGGGGGAESASESIP